MRDGGIGESGARGGVRRGILRELSSRRGGGVVEGCKSFGESFVLLVCAASVNTFAGWRDESLVRVETVVWNYALCSRCLARIDVTMR